ncbi:peroxisomal N(1)-acetyl-spermine/spermidine oxidase-like [Heterodontus francisci]|uniref:peroxisomal N(1)-acetyl-spermine/spermidine oxidase-like n=1 Tax=Heterodontus francisci TaxID=7792 RepID=UPI00355B41C4
MNSKNSLKKHPKVLIIGAGIAGVGAAGKLFKQGFTDVQIVEASSQPGGRIRGCLFGKSMVDEGAQYIHGASMKNPIFQLAKEHGLLQQTYNSSTEWSVLTNTQKQLNPDFTEEMRNLASSILRRARLLAQEKGYTQAKSLADVYLEEVKVLLIQWSGDHVDLRRQKLGMLNMSLKLQCIHLATNGLGDVSVHEYEEYKNIEGNDWLFPSLLQKLLEVIPKKKLLLEKSVKQILWNGSFESEDGSLHPVRVVCEDGDQILADHAIVTISLGCLKANSQSVFQPRLPEQHLHAIQNMGFGTMNKIYLEYEALFWDENIDQIGLVWEDETPLSGQKPNLVEWWRRVPIVYVVRPTESGTLSESTSNTASAFRFKGKMMLQVLFAGEATHRSYHSTTHGALLSGWREADRLIVHYSTK